MHIIPSHHRKSALKLLWQDTCETWVHSAADMHEGSRWEQPRPVWGSCRHTWRQNNSLTGIQWDSLPVCSKELVQKVTPKCPRFHEAIMKLNSSTERLVSILRSAADTGAWNTAADRVQQVWTQHHQHISVTTQCTCVSDMYKILKGLEDWRGICILYSCICHLVQTTEYKWLHSCGLGGVDRETM